GFPNSSTTIWVDNRDDNIRVLVDIDGNGSYEGDFTQNWVGGSTETDYLVGTFALNSSSRIQVRHQEGGGGSHHGLKFEPCFEGDPTQFGDDKWNVYTYKNQDLNLTSSSLEYVGWYTENLQSYQSTWRWEDLSEISRCGATSSSGPTQLSESPSNVGTGTSTNWGGTGATGAAYLGCPVGSDNTTIVSKRRGFDCGEYNVYISHADSYRLYIDPEGDGSTTLVSGTGKEGDGFNSNGNGYSTGVKWTGFLDESSTMELRHISPANGTNCNANFQGLRFVDISAAPSRDNATVSSQCWATDGVYDITVTTTDQGSGWGGDYGVMAIINYNQGSGSAEGYFSWHPDMYVWTEDHIIATGGGYGSKQNNWGYTKIDLIGVSTTLVGDVRTVVFTVSPNSNFDLYDDNDVYVWTSDACGNNSGAWDPFQTNFSFYNSPAAVAQVSVDDFCEGSNAVFSLVANPPVGSHSGWEYLDVITDPLNPTWVTWNSSPTATWTPSGCDETRTARAKVTIGSCTDYSDPVSTTVHCEPNVGEAYYGQEVHYNTTAVEICDHNGYFPLSIPNNPDYDYLFVLPDGDPLSGDFTWELSVSGASGPWVPWYEPVAPYDQYEGLNSGYCCSAPVNPTQNYWIRAVADNAYCPQDIGPIVELQNHNSPEPDDLTVSPTEGCVDATGDINLSATYPHGTNVYQDVIADVYSQVEFWEGGCGSGTLLATVNHTAGDASFLLTQALGTLPTATTTYYTRSVSLCETSPCKSATYTVNNNIATVTGGTAICNGASTTLNAAATNFVGTVSYVWQYSTNAGATWTNTGGNSNSLNVSPTSATHYKCIISGTGSGCSDQESNIVVVNVIDAPPTPERITSEYQVACLNSDVTLDVEPLTPGGNVATNDWAVFDGNNDWITFGDVAAMDAPTNFSFTMWFKRDTDGAASAHQINNVLISQGSSGPNDNLELGTSGTNIELYLDAGTDINIGTYPAGIVNNIWYHLGFTYDGATVRIYINGDLVVSDTSPNGALASSSTSPLALGISRAGTTNTGDFDGSIDEFRLFNTTLSQANIQALMNVEMGSGDANWGNLITYTQFNGNSTAETGINGTASGATYAGGDDITYTWSSPGGYSDVTTEPTTTISNIQLSGSDTYSVTATNSDCPSLSNAAQTFVVTVAPDVTELSSVKTDESCIGAADGEIDVTLSGGLSGVRYIRLTQLRTSDNHINLRELQAFEALTGTNVALGGTVTSTGANGSYPNANLVNGVITDATSGMFHTSSAAYGNWVMVDLGAGYNLDNILVHNRMDACCQVRANNLLLELLDAGSNVIYSNNINVDAAPGDIYDQNVLDLSWSTTPAPPVLDLDLTGLVAGTYTLTYNDVTGCSSGNTAQTLTVTPDNTAGAASSNPTLCGNTALTAITHTTTVATGIANDGVSGANGLPAGVSATWASDQITISGTPTASGIFNYSIPLTGGCASVSATGMITVQSTENNAGAAYASPSTICVGDPASIESTTDATTGTPASAGPTYYYYYKLHNTGGWNMYESTTATTSTLPAAVINTVGTHNLARNSKFACTGQTNNANTINFFITVSPNNTAGAASSSPTLCISTALTAITHATTVATGIANDGVSGANGLPAGVSATWSGDVITISGTPTASGTFGYTIPLTGGCGSADATGTITVTINNTAGAPSTTPTLCVNTALTNITHATTGATGIANDGVSGANGLPAGVSATWSGDV
ncbi:MAG: hypothetical protein GY746_11285, partial [Gammaproteobacteria bacterium]|nr:hypothetical protein [Gammaproteobacteria bacterium]